MRIWLVTIVTAALVSCGPACAVSCGATFVDRTGELFTSLLDRKASWGDYNNDGFVDLHAGGVIYKNNAGAGFTHQQDVSSDGVWADYNNDGWLDLFTYHDPNLYVNAAGGGMTRLELPAIANIPLGSSRGASWGDYDNDGDLDIFMGGYEDYPSTYYPDRILQNQSRADFEQTWLQPVESIVTPGRPRPARGVTSADFDRDGDIDVYVSNYRIEPNQLRVNSGNGQFIDQAAALGVQGDLWNGAWGHGIGSAWGDFDNDGEMDLFAGHFAHPDGQFACCPGRQTESQFFRNQGAAGGFAFENLGQLELPYAETYSSPTLGDYDNDGDLDLFLATVNSTGTFPSERAILYRNDGNWNFTDVTVAAGLASPGIQGTYQASFADYDNDGDLDLISGGRFFENQGNNNHWLKLKLVGDGQAVSRDAVGAQVRIEVNGQTLLRQVEFGTGEGNQNDPALHFGLGAQSGPVDLEVFWPGGATQLVTGLQVDQLHHVNLKTDVTLRVDQHDGTVHIENTSGASISLDGYEVRSAAGSLSQDDANWNSLADQIGNEGWIEVPASSDQLLAEVNPGGQTTLGPGESISLGKVFTRQATAFGQQPLPADLTFLASVSAGVMGGSVLYEGGDNNLRLIVDPATGEAALTNPARFNVSIDGYEIQSRQGSLQPSGWDSLAQQLPNQGWLEIGAPTAQLLAELNPAGSTELLSGDVLLLGQVFSAGGEQDVEMEFSIFDGAAIDGLVQYGQIPRFGANNLVLAVDPHVGHAVLVNSSGGAVEIDGYEIRSPSGSLSTANWQSLQENPDFAGWQEVGAPSDELLAELQADGSTMLSSGELIWLGPLFAAAGEHDLRFEFSTAGGDVIAGPVLYRSLPEFERPGDYDGNGLVNGGDLLAWQRGESPTPLSQADLATWQRYYAVAGGMSAGNLLRVPEPASAIAAAIFGSATCFIPARRLQSRPGRAGGSTR